MHSIKYILEFGGNLLELVFLLLEYGMFIESDILPNYGII